MDTEGLLVEECIFDKGISKFDLSLHAKEADDKISLSFDYSTDLFHRSTIESMSRCFLKIAEDVTGNDEILIADIDISAFKS